MKKLIFSLATCVSMCGSVPSASAFTYHYGDLLLVFRSSGLNDVEFNLGSVTNYLNYAPGSVHTVAGWNPGLVTANRPSGTLADDHFILLATAGQANATQQASEADFLTGPGYPFPLNISQTLFPRPKLDH